MKKCIILILLLLSLMLLSGQKTTTKAAAEKAKPLVTFIELGSVNCVPCKMMKPVMKEVEEAYGDTIEIIFHDITLPKNRSISSKYKVKVMPTQVFLDKDGKEFSRHEGFYPASEIIKLLDKKLGVDRNKPKE